MIPPSLQTEEGGEKTNERGREERKRKRKGRNALPASPWPTRSSKISPCLRV